jgi:hypothetical protein
MSTSPPASPRFIPTLTEVVTPPSSARGVLDEASSEEALIAALTQQLSWVIERRLADSCEVLIRNMLAEQAQSLAGHLKLELEATVRDVVQKTFFAKRDKNN